MTKVQFIRLLFAATLLSLAPAAFADTIEFSTTTNIQLAASSPNDNFWGEYRTPPGAIGTQSSIIAEFGFNLVIPATLSNVSYFLPPGSMISSATMSITFPSIVTGTAQAYITEGLPSPGLDPSPRLAPTFDNGASKFFIDEVEIPTGGTGFPYSMFPSTPIIAGNEVSTGAFALAILGSGNLTSSVATQGFNWDGYIGGDGQAILPLTVKIDVDYTVVPEPPPFVLISTALALSGLIAPKCRKWFAS
jgi:hypothetical protein